MNVIKETHFTAEGFFVACLCLLVCVVGGGCCRWDVAGCARVSLRQCRKPAIVEVVCRCCYLLLHSPSSLLFGAVTQRLHECDMKKEGFMSWSGSDSWFVQYCNI